VAVRRGEGKWSEADVLTLAANGQRIEVFVDRSTHLMRRIYYPDSCFPDIVIRGYRDMEGILMPNAVKAAWVPAFKGHPAACAYTLRVSQDHRASRAASTARFLAR
jgi:hypothetical protein